MHKGGYHDRRKQRAAIDQANYAQRMGWLKPQPCRDCGQPDWRVLHKHHPDYDKPLDVVWLCNSCHQNEHVRLYHEAKSGAPPPPAPIYRKRRSSELNLRRERIERLLATSPDVYDIDLETMEVHLKTKT